MQSELNKIEPFTPSQEGEGEEIAVISSKEVDKIFSALAIAQGEFSCAEEGASNPYFNSKYANFSSLKKASQKHLTKNGLCVSHIPTTINGKRHLVTIIGHSSGQWIKGDMEIPMPKSETSVDKYGKEKKVNILQAMGSSITYLCRYAYKSMLGITTGEDKDDDDGESYPCEIEMCSQEEYETLNSLIKQLGKDAAENMCAYLKKQNCDSKEKMTRAFCLEWIKRISNKLDQLKSK
jgi:hypothetical protein